MRELLTSLLLVSCLLPMTAGAMKVSSHMMQFSKPHAFTNLDDEPLWTSQVRRVDLSDQSYERLPARLSSFAMAADAKPASSAKAVNRFSIPQELANEGELSSASPVKAQSIDTGVWCSSRYRSYDPGSNTYQPYGGGPRRTCVPPTGMQAPEHIAGVRDAIGLDGNARWCMDRYSSYRVEDNTYQPFTGTRKQCLGPGSQSASNAVGNSSVAQF